MDLEKYKELTGVDVSPAEEARVKAAIRRTKSKLETLLGYSLKPKNIYTEKGKVPYEGLYPLQNNSNLQEPDEQEGVFKLFSYNEKDPYIFTDPFTNVYKVKLVAPVLDNEFITVATLENWVPQYSNDGTGRFIGRKEDWFLWFWYNTWRTFYSVAGVNKLQIAVDADWATCYSEDVMYLWADMIQYYSNENYSVSGSIKSESVDGHSWSRGNAGGSKEGDLAPQETADGKLILRNYAGPNGTAASTRNPIC